MPGRHPLSLHDERGERRAKGRGETHLDGFSSPFGNPHLFRKSRNASARQARGVSGYRGRKGSSRDVGIFELKRQRRGNYLDVIENVSAFGANRGYASGRCPPPPRGKRAGAYVYECEKAVFATMALKSQGRGNHAVLSIL